MFKPVAECKCPAAAPLLICWRLERPYVPLPSPFSPACVDRPPYAPPPPPLPQVGRYFPTGSENPNRSRGIARGGMFGRRHA